MPCLEEMPPRCGSDFVGMIKHMIKWFFALLAAVSIPVRAGQDGWAPSMDPVGSINGRVMETFHHGVKPEWGYPAPQQDTFIVVHPKAARAKAPLYVVLQSAGHDVRSCVECSRQPGNHDIYHSPVDFYALYLDCRANQGDWWWGGMHAGDAGLVKKNSGGALMPVEKRVLDTVRWVIAKYGIDADRV